MLNLYKILKPLFSFVVFILLCQSVFAQELRLPPTEDRLEKLTVQAIWQLRRDAYDSAFATIDEMRMQFPDAPHGDLLAADAYQTMMRDYRVRLFEAEFDSVIDVTISKAKSALRQERTGMLYFILGTAQGYLGIHDFYKGNLLRGVSTALSGIKTMRSALRVDPDFADPLFALAVYDFGQYKALGWGLGFFRKKRDSALEQLKQVQANGRFAVLHAYYSQQMIHYDGEEYEKALAINDILYKRFYNNPSCLYHRALLLDKTGHYPEAAEIWQKLINRINAFERASNGYLAESYYHLAVNLWTQGEKEQGLTKIEQAASFMDAYHEDDEMQGPYFKYKDLKNWIKDNRKDWAKSLDSDQ